jgi:hypothetical protein
VRGKIGNERVFGIALRFISASASAAEEEMEAAWSPLRMTDQETPRTWTNILCCYMWMES